MPEAETWRVFLGFAVQPAHALHKVTRQLQQSAHEAGVKVRATPEKNLHVTVKFIGNTDPDAIAPMVDALDTLDKTAPKQATLVGIGAFPHVVKPRSVYAAVEEQKSFVQDLGSRVDALLEPLGVACEDKSRVPHVTLLRVKRNHAWPQLKALVESHTQTPMGTVNTTTLVIYRSTLTSEGAIYTPLHRVTL